MSANDMLDRVFSRLRDTLESKSNAARGAAERVKLAADHYADAVDAQLVDGIARAMGQPANDNASGTEDASMELAAAVESIPEVRAMLLSLLTAAPSAPLKLVPAAAAPPVVPPVPPVEAVASPAPRRPVVLLFGHHPDPRRAEGWSKEHGFAIEWLAVPASNSVEALSRRLRDGKVAGLLLIQAGVTEHMQRGLIDGATAGAVPFERVANPSRTSIEKVLAVLLARLDAKGGGA